MRFPLVGGIGQGIENIFVNPAACGEDDQGVLIGDALFDGKLVIGRKARDDAELEEVEVQKLGGQGALVEARW